MVSIHYLKKVGHLGLDCNPKDVRLNKHVRLSRAPQGPLEIHSIYECNNFSNMGTSDHQ